MNTGRVERVRYNTTYPANNAAMASKPEKRKPFLSYTLPHSAVTTEAIIMAGAMIST